MKKICVLMFVLMFLVASVSAWAGTSTVTLQWDPPAIATDVVGYKVYQGTASGTYSQSFDAGPALTYTLSGLADGTYYFAVTAYNAAKYDSEYSNEVSVTLYSQPPAAPSNLRSEVQIQFGVTVRTIVTGK